MGTAIGLSCIERGCQYRAKCNEITLSNIAIRKFNVYGGIKLGRDQPLELIREPSATYASRASRASHVIACHVYINITRLLLSEGIIKRLPQANARAVKQMHFLWPRSHIASWDANHGLDVLKLKYYENSRRPVLSFVFFLFCFVLFCFFSWPWVRSVGVQYLSIFLERITQGNY